MVSHGEEIDMWKAEVDSLQLLLANPEEGLRLLQVGGNHSTIRLQFFSAIIVTEPNLT